MLIAKTRDPPEDCKVIIDTSKLNAVEIDEIRACLLLPVTLKALHHLFHLVNLRYNLQSVIWEPQSFVICTCAL